MSPIISTVLRSQLHPSSRLTCSSKVPLSITDCTAAKISGPSAIWFFDSLSSSETPLSSRRLIDSLQQTLVSHPFFAGYLESIPFRAHGCWNERHGRYQAVFGGSDDPGIELVVARCAEPLGQWIPQQAELATEWDANSIPFTPFSCEDMLLSLHDGFSTGPSLPVMGIKITAFACGGCAIAAKITHPLADAQTLTRFIHAWADVHRELLVPGSVVPPVPAPVFDPERLNRAAAGDINAEKPDWSIMNAASSLPQHRFDWWASVVGCPDNLLGRTRRPAVLDGVVKAAPLGEPLPWDHTDLASPVSYYHLHFSAGEIDGIYSAAASRAGVKISRLDALLAHIWSLICQARELDDGDASVYFNAVVNLRDRLSPKLPESFVGSPCMLGYARSTAAEASKEDSQTLGHLAASIRSSILQFNPTTIPNVLHEFAHQVDLHRYQRAWIGQDHVTATSWLHHGMYTVDFGTNSLPRFVEAMMPNYMICVTEGFRSEPQGRPSNQTCSRKPWYATGATVSMHFEAAVMGRLLKNPRLRAYSRNRVVDPAREKTREIAIPRKLVPSDVSVMAV